MCCDRVFKTQKPNTPGLGLLWLGLIVIAIRSLPAVAEEKPFAGMLTLSIEGRKLEGQPLLWNAKELCLLGRDGQLWRIEVGRIKDWKPSASTFRAYEPSWFRATLLEELGKDYEVSGTGHYLVAHPRSQGERWARRLEDFYRDFVHFFSVRGFSPSMPPFPLVAIVCHNKHDFYKRTAVSSFGGNEAQGYYDIQSNRLMIFDMPGKTASALQQKNMAVLVHEAAHQAAFNTGIHSRYNPPPLWLAEGLAMLFEAAGVYAPREHLPLRERINAGRLQAYRRLPDEYRRAEALALLVAEDTLFESNPPAAYAGAWALSFFLIENEAAKYFSYLQRTASRPAFQPYTKTERLADFASSFGGNWAMLHARLERFVNSLP